jgi:predicted CXXCH cytochrome family protein
MKLSRKIFQAGFLKSRRAQVIALTLIATVYLLSAISCRTVTRTAVVLPNVPGAKYIGSKECEQCHDEITRSFATADHVRLIAQGKNGINAGCESCHGPASLHSDSGGETKPPFSFTSGRPQTAGLMARVPVGSPRAVENVCYQCHADIRGQFNLPNHHPVPEGRMSCTQCHPPHKGIAHAGGSTRLLAQEENCTQCHPSQRGPYVFEHEASREGCTTCHNPHGSVNAKMLTERDSNLCLKCHFQQVKGGSITIGGFPHDTQVSQGACWSAGCHEAVHGSRVNSSLRF